MAELNATAASILGFLTMGPRTGWDLARLAEQSIGNFWNVTRSQVYRELRDLADRGLAEAGVAGPRDRLPYSITPAGKAAFAEWIATTPGPDLVRNRLLLTVFFADHLDPGRLADILDDQEQRHTAELERYLAMEPLVREAGAAMAATLRFGISYEQLMVAWIRSVRDEFCRPGGGPDGDAP